MEAVIFGLLHGAKHLFIGQRPLNKWAEKSTPDDILKGLTKLYVKGSDEWNFSGALTPSEISILERKLKSTPQTTPLSECLRFYACYPFAPRSSPLTRDDMIRAVSGLTGRNKRILGDKKTIHQKGEETRVRQRGMDDDDRLRLLFCALSGAKPNQEDLLDVLYITQPRPDECMLPRGHERLLPVAERLVPKSSGTEDAVISKEKFRKFMIEIGFESVEVNETVSSLEEFKRVLGEEGRGVVMDALKRKIERMFLSA